MGVWTLLQIIVNLALFVGIASIWLRLRRPPKDDPRLSRGLQLLQSKISVLEDLSDRTDRQVTQLTKLLDNKSHQLKTKFLEAEKQIQKLQSSMDRSMEVASIFQDKIPHSEIIERQNTIKHVQAARMAHAGHSVEEILAATELPREQVEFIAKVNKDQLMFDETQLPAWIEDSVDADTNESWQTANASEADLEQSITSEAQSGSDQDHSLLNIDAFDMKADQQSYESLKKLGDEFREACKDFDERGKADAQFARAIEDKVSEVKQKVSVSPAFQKAKTMTSQILQSVGDSLNSGACTEKTEVLAAESDNLPPEEGRASDVPEVESEEVEAQQMDATRPEQPSPQPERVTKVVPSEPGLNRSNRIVRDVEIKKVVFPNVDLSDNLG